jgi:hypothetical protein
MALDAGPNPLAPSITSPALQIAEIEAAIGCGQVEELVQQAKGELILIPEYASWCVLRCSLTRKEADLAEPFAPTLALCRRWWEMPPPSLDDDCFSDVYDDLEFMDPDGPMSPILRELAAKKRAEKAAAAASAAPKS